MRRKSTQLYCFALLSLAAAVMACNLPLTPSPGTEQPPEEILIQTEVQPVETVEDIIETALPIVTAERVIETNLPIVRLEGGNGYIFSSQQITKDDRDVWWNNAQFVPATKYRMVSLGIISSPADITEITFIGETAQTFEPAPGEGYAIEIDRGNELKYAVFRVVKIDSDRTITFDWVYPFVGTVTINP